MLCAAADNEGFDHYFNDSNDSSYGYRMLSTIPEIDDDNDDTEDSTNSSYESSSSSASSSEWRTETAWPWFQTDWNVYIINAKSTTEVWAQLIGSEYSDALDSLTEKIALAKKHHPETVAINEIYVTFAFGQWRRVRTLKAMKSACYECFSIDTGKEFLIPSKSLYVCETTFRTLLPQALCLTLIGLADFAEHPHAEDQLKKFLNGKAVVANVWTNEMEYLKYSPTQKKILVELYDTSNPHRNIKLNKLLMEKIIEFTPTPKLQAVASGRICYVSKIGKVYLHLTENDLKFVNKLIKQIVIDPDRLQLAQATPSTVFSKHLYLVYDEFDKQWYRANVISNGHIDVDPSKSNAENSFVFPNESTPDKNHHRMNNVRLCFCIDFGITKAIKLSNIYNLHSLSMALYKYPCQAIPLKLNRLPMFSTYVLTRLRCIFDAGTNVIVKAATLDTIPPIVDIYKRDVLNNNLLYINEWIAKEEELQNVGVYLELKDSFTLDD